MNAFENFVTSALSEAIGWTILHSLWEGALLAALLACVLWATRSPRVRYAAACAALLAFLCAFGFTLAELLSAGRTAAPFKPVLSAWSSASAEGGVAFGHADFAAAVRWLAPLWLCGILLIYARMLGGCVSLGRLRRRGVCCAAERWQNTMARLATRLRISRAVQLLESSLAEAPFVLGHFRPLIFVPAGLLCNLSASQVEAILLHELAHIRRCDYVANAMQHVAEGLLFYHPAAWWISRVIRAERENCCDDIVVSVTADPREYARTLMELENYRLANGQAVVAATGGSLMKRVQRLLYPKVQSAWAPLIAAAMLLTVGAVTLAAWQANSFGESASLSRATSAAEPATAQTSAPGGESAAQNVYSKWLNEDVVYIIDDAERAAFEKLTTDAEREEFIKQFWARRNPNPGSATNKFKQEHYRRIAYANQHFRTTSRTPGWQTDRGHILIVYGPPDEIDSHAKDEGGTAKPAIEVWTYRHIDGLGSNDSITFIDRTGRGDYHLAPSNTH